jgi:hypothetical protein
MAGTWTELAITGLARHAVRFYIHVLSIQPRIAASTPTSRIRRLTRSFNHIGTSRRNTASRITCSRRIRGQAFRRISSCLVEPRRRSIRPTTTSTTTSSTMRISSRIIRLIRTTRMTRFPGTIRAASARILPSTSPGLTRANSVGHPLSRFRTLATTTPR